MVSEAFGNCYQKLLGMLFPQIFSCWLYFPIEDSVKHSSLQTEYLCLPSLHPSTLNTLCSLLKLVYFLHNTFYYLKNILFIYLFTCTLPDEAKMKEVHHIDQGLTNISIKIQIVNVLSFPGHNVSVTTNELCYFSTKAHIDNT